jgi:hypothetical protein
VKARFAISSEAARTSWRRLLSPRGVRWRSSPIEGEARFRSAAIVSVTELARNAACKVFTNSSPLPVLFQRVKDFVDIRFISSLTDHDEDRFASIVLKAMADLLSKTPITYVVRIETTDGKVFQRSRTGAELPHSTSTTRNDSDPCHQPASREKVEDWGS